MNKQNQKTETRIHEAFSQLTPVYDPDVLEQPVSTARGDEWYLEGTGTKKKRNLILPVLAMAAVLVLMIGGFRYYRTYMRTYATVYLDLNPSLRIAVNAQERVTSVHADNEDARIILADMDLKNVQLNTALNAVVGSMVRHGYLDEAHNVLLLSLSCEDAEYGHVLNQKLSDEINAYLDTSLGRGYVLCQEIDVNEDDENMAEKYSMSPGKARLIREAVKADPSLDYEKLAAMPVSDLVRYLYENGFNLRPYSDEVEDLLEAEHIDDDPYEHMFEDEDHDRDDSDDEHDDDDEHEDHDDGDHGDDD